jgi:hypothetical protein
MKKPILDPCCGSKMFWFDPSNECAVFTDKRTETHTLCDGRILNIKPDFEMDFRDMIFEDESFYHIILDPPHLQTLGKKSWMALKYGVLENDWQADLKQAFSECFRVLKPFGTLMFKWNENEIKVSEILKLTAVKPLYGHKSGKRSDTHWIVFMKTTD